MQGQTDLAAKLKIQDFDQIGLINQDPYSPELLAIARPMSHQSDIPAYQALFVHTYSLEEMKQSIYKVWQRQKLAHGGLLYLVYPKLDNPHYPGIHRDAIFPALGVDDALGLVPATQLKFNRMVRLNDIFTIIGLKYLTTKDLGRLNQTRPSNRVEDYVQYLGELEAQLDQLKVELKQAFQSLTPGKQRQWAREIYSARTEETRNKRYQKLVLELQSLIN